MENVIYPSCFLCPQTQASNPQASSFQVLETQKTITCLKCSKNFCPIHASKLDIRYCSSCFSDVTVKDDTFTRTEEEYDEFKDKFYRRTEKCRSLSFNGLDWLFASQAINSLEEVALATTIEYHKAMVNLIEHEIITRKVNKLQEKIKVYGSSDSYLKSQRITEKRTKTTVKREKLTLEKIIQTLKNAGVTAEMMSKQFGSPKNISSVSNTTPLSKSNGEERQESEDKK